jgi:3-hydroxybutyryl-CoA dehydrogenase
MEIKKITVVGAGNMGHQIALSTAIAGFEVCCTDANPEVLSKAIAFTEHYLNERVLKEKLTKEEASFASTRLRFVDNLTEAVVDTDLVIEAIIENLEIKKDLFRQLDSLCPEKTILATNSSYIVSSKIAFATNRPEKVCNMHFFNPALVMKLVEVVKGPHVSEETAFAVMQAAERMGKTPVLLHKEIYGFLVNRFLQATRNEALRLLDMGVASHEDIDKAVMNGLGFPMGPFQLLDLTGIDLAYHVNMEKYKETGDPADRPSPAIVEKFIKGQWGRKTKKGFYEYE